MKAFFRKHRFKIVLTFLVIVFVYICFYMLWVHVPYTKHKNDLVSIQEEICSQYHYDYDDYFNAYQNKKINYIVKVKNKKKTMYVVCNKKLKNRLTTGTFALLIALLAVVSATYAWYVYNTGRHTTKVRMAAGAVGEVSEIAPEDISDGEDVGSQEAEEILDEDHYGLKKVKERIIQQLAVMALNKKQSGSILLFVGAPGTGKTSIGQSIARALHREYVRISLGGIRDEAEIRGHRRTYVGAMPGRIMEGMKRSKAQNPVMVLDEVDKLAKDYGGDPASALLEVLDPEQNYSFTDHYMNVPYDLSNVFFVCTANSTDTIPEPLLNRMEVIQFPGYTPLEKFHIARRHLLPKAMKAMGIKAQNLKVTDGALEKIIAEYTAESGVRGLKKQVDVICRNAAVKLVRGEQKSITVNEKRVQEFLGSGIIHDTILKHPQPGVMTGLAWTSAGGEILFIETSFTKGSGKITITGQLGDVMKESAQIAITLVKKRHPDKADLFKENDLHIHVPSGAVPKDGPSAGITLVTALTSLVTDTPVNPEYAMTGEVSLRGGVMPIGGLPEKLMAAQRAGIKKVFIPAENERDLEEVAEEVKEKLEIVPVETVDQVMRLVFA